MQQGRRRITVDLGSADLYKALRIAAVEHDSSMKEVIVQALEDWLARQRDARAVAMSSREATLG